MLIDRPVIVEGSAIQNPTVPAGPSFPDFPNVGELFFLTQGQVGLFSYTGSAWETFTRATEFLAHKNDDTRHLTTAQNTLLDGINVTFTDVNSIPTLNSRLTTAEGTLATHVANDTVHLSSLQNAFLDGLNLPALTASNLNFLVGVTSSVQDQLNTTATQVATQASQIQQLQTSSSGGQTAIQNDLDTHKSDDTRHLTASQNTLLDSISVGAAPINKLQDLEAFLGSTQLLYEYLQQLNMNKLSTNGSIGMLGNLDMGGNRVSNAANPIDPHDLTTKEYVDNFVNGIHWIQSVDVTTTEQINLLGLQTIDGYDGQVGTRVLVKDQTDPTQNGVWDMAVGSWNRSSDYNVPAEVNKSAVFVLNGLTQAKATFVQTATVTLVGGDAITFTAFSGPVVTSAGPGIALAAGGQVSVVEGAGLGFSGSALVVDLYPTGGLITTLDGNIASTDTAAKLSLAKVGTAGSYTKVSTDNFGRVVSGSNPTTLAGFGITDAVSQSQLSSSSSTLVIDGGTY